MVLLNRYASDITLEDRERIDLSELLAAINASHKEYEASKYILNLLTESEVITGKSQTEALMY